jgi:drug/metabolite transporter (DMT)-like permease
MAEKKRFPLRLACGLALAIALDTAVQVSWKVAVTNVPPTVSAWDELMAMLHQPVFVVVAVLLACQLANWLKVLEHADLSYAQPITSLSYVSVCLCSALYLKEPVDGLQLTGIGFVLAGVWFISRTDHLSPAGDGVAP